MGKLCLIAICSALGVQNILGEDRDNDRGKNAMNILHKKPEFFLRINASEAKYFARVNGISVYREYDRDGEINMDLPVNAYMCSGKNTINLKLFPYVGEDQINESSAVTIELWVRPHHPKMELDGYKITDIKFEGELLDEELGCVESAESGTFSSQRAFIRDDDGDVVVGDFLVEEDPGFKGALEVSREVTIPSNLPLWNFFNGDELPDYDSWDDDPYYDARDEIYEAVYVKFQECLENEDVEGILEMCSERNQEMDKAFYFEPGTYAKMQRESLETTFEDENFELVSLPANILTIIREDNGRLVSLCRKQCEAAIGYNLVGGGGSLDYPIMCRKQNGKWIITR